jgi:hypothetical protein
LARPRVTRGLRGRQLASRPLAHRTLSGVPPDSPVIYSRTPPTSPESGLFTRVQPGAHHRTLSGAPPDTPVYQAELKLAAHSQHFFLFFSSSFLSVSST